MKPGSPPTTPRPKRLRRVRPAVAAPLPRPFDFGFTERRPLVPLAAVTMFLDKSPREVMALIEDGRLRWAFDIRSATARGREVRVLRQSLFEFTGLYVPPPIRHGSDDAEFARIVNLILPPGVMMSPTVTPTGGAQPARNEAARRLQERLRLTAGAVQGMLFPKEPVLSGTEVARSFSCNSQHILNLLREKSFNSINLRRGPKASPLMTRSSVVEFLRSRRIY